MFLIAKPKMMKFRKKRKSNQIDMPMKETTKKSFMMTLSDLTAFT